MPRSPMRIDGYAPIRDYGVIGNERTAALVALDGAVDWLCLPDFESPAVFAGLLDPESGGRLTLTPSAPFDADREYVGETNVLATTFNTADGAVRVTDAMTIPETAPLPWSELLRRVEGLSGEVELRYTVAPRFGWGTQSGELLTRQGVPMFRCGREILTVHGWGMGEVTAGDGGLEGRLTVRDGESALLGLGAFHDEPVLLSDRRAVERRLDETIDYWSRRAARVSYSGPWRDAVVRSAQVLELMVYGPTGGVLAAATSSLPERIGGDRNYDYRFCWLRDMSFTLEAMLRLGFDDQVHASLSWLLRTTRRTHPRMSVFYQLDGEPPVGQRPLELRGYRGSPPVEGNGAGGQLQLGNYADILQTAWLYVNAGNALDPEGGMRLGEVADLVCEIWRNHDSGIWELSEQHDYTQGKLATWLALDRGIRLAEAGEVPGHRVGRWRRQAEEARRFVETRCWSEERGSYLRYPGADGLDAAVLLGARRTAGFFQGDSSHRLERTIDALRRELGRGPLLYRFSGMESEEGAFLACSFWLVEALAVTGRRDEAEELMSELVELGNDLRLYSEEIDPETGEFLGNFPQALSHLALVNAAYTLEEQA